MEGRAFRAIGVAALAAVFLGTLALPAAGAIHSNGACYYGSGYVHYETTGPPLAGVQVDPPVGPGYWSNWAVCASSTKMTCTIYVMDGTTVEIYLDRYSSILQVEYKNQYRNHQFHRDWSCSQSSVEVRLEPVAGLDSPSLKLVSVAF